MEQRLHEGCGQLCQKTERRQQRSAGCAACRRFAAQREDACIDGQKAQQKAAPALHLRAERLCLFHQIPPEQDTTAARRSQIQQIAVGTLSRQKPQHRGQCQEQENRGIVPGRLPHHCPKGLGQKAFQRLPRRGYGVLQINAALL